MDSVTHVPTPRSLWKGPALMTAFLLVFPLLGNHFVEGWNWRPFAFVVLGAVLFGIGFTYEVITRNVGAIAYRAAVGIAFATAFILCWGNLVQWADVNPDAVMYFGVPVVGIIGAIVARLRPKGMALALFATALAQIAVLAVVLIRFILRHPQLTFWSTPELRGFAGNAVDALLFLGSAWLFRKAAQQRACSNRQFPYSPKLGR